VKDAGFKGRGGEEGLLLEESAVPTKRGRMRADAVPQVALPKGVELWFKKERSLKSLKGGKRGVARGNILTEKDDAVGHGRIRP